MNPIDLAALTTGPGSLGFLADSFARLFDAAFAEDDARAKATIVGIARACGASEA